MAIYPIAQMADGGVKYSDGSIKYASYNNAIGSSTGGNPIYPSSNNVLETPAPSNQSVAKPSNNGGSSGGGNPQPSNNGGGGGNPNPQPSGPSDAERKQMEAIGGAWDSYIKSLDDMMNGLSGQRRGLEQQASAQIDSGLGQLKGQYDIGQSRLNKETDKAFEYQKSANKDLADNLINQYHAGNVYLGSRGAGDSSAVGQYAYGLQKLGNQGRAKILNQTQQNIDAINQRKFELDTTYNQQRDQLEQERRAQMASIATWYNNSLNELRGARGTALRDKGLSIAQLSLDLLNKAKDRANQINDFYRNKQSALDSWALSQADSLQQGLANLGAVANFYSQAPQGYEVNANPYQNNDGAGFFVGQGSTKRSNDKKDLLNIFA